jgi:predicted esterase
MNMNPQQHHISVTKTARYCTLGELNSKTKDIWLLLHGHNQLAGRFINRFNDLAEAGSYLIAPEGLMRFYSKGDNGDVGASWMTKEDRESDIKDYVNYLDQLFDYVVKPAKENYNIKVNSLGFSQGAATLSRWLALGKTKVDKAVFWCGNLAHDVDYSRAESLLSTDIHLVFADNDKYYPKDFYHSQEKILSEAGINYQTQIFSGGHEVSFELMKSCGIL